MKQKPRPQPHEWVAKATWHATALHFLVEARDEAHALLKAWGRVSRMEGGNLCLTVELLRQVR